MSTSTDGEPAPAARPSPSWSEMFHSASVRAPSVGALGSRASGEGDQKGSSQSNGEGDSAGLSLDSHARLALYIAVAHAGLALSILVLYGLYLLLNGFLRPLQWALLCSIPLRETQRALVDFWTPPLRSGVVATVLAVPGAALDSAATTLLDARAALLRRRLPPSPSFPRLLRYLLTAAILFALYTNLGILALPVSVILFVFATYLSRPSYGRSRPSTSASGDIFTRKILLHLHTIVAIGLMFFMLFGFLGGGVFFSYKIGVEGKDAVMSLKSHVENNNYTEKIGFKKWIEDNDVPGLVDRYSALLSDTVWEHVDQLATQYNLTDFSNGFRQFLISQSVVANVSETAVVESTPHPYSVKLQAITECVKKREWAGIYRESYSFVQELIVAREDLVEKAKVVAFQGLEVGKKLLSSGTSVVGGSANLVFSIALRIVSGAAEVLNFVSQLTVFLWLLFYLITSEAGGATEQIVGMLPISRSVKTRCVDVIDHAVSSVFLAAAKIAIFQGCFTWLLFSALGLHFVFTSTVFAFLSPLLPILPTWLSSCFAAGELLMEKKYILALVLTFTHLVLMDHGASLIQEEIPGYNGYLTGLSIIGGMALFPNAMEGALLGPLILTVVIALKNLYTEFVLSNPEVKSEKID